MTEAEKNEIVGLVMNQISSQAVDFDIETEQPQANDLLTAVRETSPGVYEGVTIKWDDVARIATELANQAATRAEQAKTNVENMKSSVEQTVTDFNALAEEKKQEVQGVYQSDINELKGDIDNLEDVFISGIELFDKNYAINGYYTKDNGDKVRLDGVSTTYPIKVEENTTYVVNKGSASSSFPLVIFFNANEEVLSTCNTQIFTTPIGTKYVIFNTLTSYIETFSFNYGSNVIDNYEYKKVLSPMHSPNAFIWCDNSIVYDDVNGILKSSSPIYITVNEERISLGTNIEVGNGAFLYYDSSTNSLTATNDNINSKTSYFVGIIKNYDFNIYSKSFESLTASEPIIEIDLINSKANINTESTTYLIVCGCVFLVPTIIKTLDLPSHCLIYYNLSTQDFEVGEYKFNPMLLPIIKIHGNNIDSKIPYKSFTENKCFGKKCACYGDSITWYDGNAYTGGKAVGTIAVGYESYMRKYLGMTVENYGNSGYSMPQILHTVKATTWMANYDYVTLTSGANDERKNTPLGELLPIGSVFDESTFYGAIQSAIEFILSKKPSMKIILMTPIKGWIYAPNGYEYPRTEDGDITPKWANAIKEIANLYSLPVCDWYNKSGINLLNREIYINDNEPENGNDLYSLHPSALGYKRMSEILLPIIENC